MSTHSDPRETVAREVHAIWRDGFNEEHRAKESWEANEVFHDEFYADADRILAALAGAGYTVGKP